MEVVLLIILIGIIIFMIRGKSIIRKNLDDIIQRQKRMFTKILLMDTNQRLNQEILIELRKELAVIREQLEPQTIVNITVGPVTEQN